MKKVVFLAYLLISTVKLVAQTNEFYYSNDTTNELIVVSLAVFIKTDSINYDSLVNRFKDFYNLQGKNVGFFDDEQQSCEIFFQINNYI
jgi:hypothetical protein